MQKKKYKREKTKKSIYLFTLNTKHSLRASVDVDANDHLLIHYQDNS